MGTKPRRCVSFLYWIFLTIVILLVVAVLSVVAAIAGLFISVVGATYLFIQFRRLVKYEKSLTIKS